MSENEKKSLAEQWTEIYNKTKFTGKSSRCTAHLDGVGDLVLQGSGYFSPEDALALAAWIQEVYKKD